ncbi:MAG: hypothetical protein HGA39_09215 [Coriobacteriia bacterium]|nr:hypothetical protein [Coriobacteriia bacterium]
MVFPVALVLALAFALLGRVRAVQESLPWTIATAICLGLALSAMVASPPVMLTFSWPFILGAWFSIGWKTAVDWTWRGYVKARQCALTPRAGLPDARVMLMVPYNTVISVVLAIGAPLGVLLWTRYLEGMLALSGYPASRVFSLAPAVVFGLALFGLVSFWLLLRVARRKNPWYATQIKLAWAAASTGARRRHLFDEAIASEPAEERASWDTSNKGIEQNAKS